MRIFLIFLFALVLGFSAQAKSGYRIEMNISNFDGDSIIFANYYGSTNAIVDTLVRNRKGKFVAQGKKNLPGGVYLIILPPDNKYFELLIDKEQRFSLKTNTEDFTSSMKIKNSKENRMFYDYLRFISKKREEVKTVSDNLKEAKTAEDEEKYSKQREKIEDEVSKYFKNIRKQHPHSILALILKSTQPVDMPDELNGENADEQKRYLYYKNHYFDNLDRADERLLRSNFLFNRITYYEEKLTPQTPDSINVAIDYILKPMKKDGELFKYYLIHFLNKYAKSKIVGMDGVYVHIAKNYYEKGLAPWTEEKTLNKIIKNANDLAPILIGKKAPNIKMQKRDGSQIELDTIQSDYIVLYFWDPDCGHCKKASPQMIAFQEKFQSKGVMLFGICSKLGNDVPECWKTIDERGYNWMNVVDPYLKSRYKMLYNIKTTPQIFILDKNKKIKIKRIGSDQLDDVMTKIIEQDAKDKKK